MNKETLFSTPVIGALIIGLIAGVLVSGFFVGSDEKGDMSYDDGNNAMSDEVALGDDTNTTADSSEQNELEAVADIGIGEGQGSVTVSDQSAGDLVVIDSITVESDSWVTVRESLEGRLTNIIGVGLVNAGTQTNLEVTLDRPTQAGNMYYVTIFGDNGDRLFNYVVDLQLAQDGEIIRDSFMAQ